jgi:acetyl esterase/lipase
MTSDGKFDVRKGLVYATHDGVELAGDLYLPQGRDPFPAVIGIHGGGWQYGARDELQYWVLTWLNADARSSRSAIGWRGRGTRPTRKPSRMH